jgi:molybdopterin molybdotransferase
MTATAPLLVEESRRWNLRSIGDAQQAFFAQLPRATLRTESIPVSGAMHLILAEDVVADRNIPEYPRAAVDGYAVGSRHTVAASATYPLLLEVVARVLLGESNPLRNIEKGEAAYIACGAPLPPGTDAVVRLEETKAIQGDILLVRPVQAGENVDAVAQDVRKGELVLPRGLLLRPQDLGMLTTLGRSEVSVVRKPVVAVLPVGSELYEAGSPANGGVPEKNSLILAQLLREFYGIPHRLKPVRDDLVLIAHQVRMASDLADLVVTLGGCSVGVKDLVPTAVNSLGSPGVLVHGVAVFPGKPVGLGCVGGKPIVMLPGRIMSALAGFYLFVLPLLARLTAMDLGRLQPTVGATLRNNITSRRGAARFEALRVIRNGSGYEAASLPKGVDLLNNLVRANGYVVVPPNTQVAAGQEVNVHLFSRGELYHIQA